MYKFICFILVLSIAAILGDLPAGVTKCHAGDNDCFKKTTQEVLKMFSNGLREINLLPFDPLRIKSLVLERNPSSPVNLELKFKDLDVIGLKTVHVKEVKGFNFKERSVFEAVVPELIVKGKYSVNGKVLILPVKGNGETIITSKNIHFKYTFDLKPVTKNGKVFAELEHVKLEFKPEHMKYQFDNLFNGDKALGDSMNKFLNENWRDIYSELEGSFAKAISLIVKQMINNVSSKYPYDSLFL